MKQPSILVIDDEPDNFDVIEIFLSSQQYTLHYASSGSEAISSLELLQPDVILLDVMMPDMDGIATCQHIKASPHWESIPVIMVTALTGKEDLARCLEAGADDFISKPVSNIELRARIKSMLRIKQQYDRIKALSTLQASTITLLQSNLNELSGNLATTLPHEMNTPLNGISGVLSLLNDGYQDMSDAEIRSWLTTAQLSAQRLEQLTKRLLQYTQLEILASNPEITHTTHKLRQTIPTQFWIEHSLQEKGKQFDRLNDLEWNLINAEVPIKEKDLVWIVNELLDNAFKFSQSGTPVQVTSQIEGNSFQLLICDQGRGMTRDQIATIGTFKQLEHQCYGPQGIGLGLKIVKRIVEIYRGRFSISSNRRLGTAVHIELPLSV